MTWAKLDDRFHEHRKIKRVWRADPAAVGLHVMAITYCAGHETDGLVDHEFVEEKMPSKAARERAIGVLIEAGAWDLHENGWKIHDYLDFNPSRADLEAKRGRDADRKAKGREKAAAKRDAGLSSGNRPRGLFADTSRSPQGVGAASSGPDPTRPDPYPPSPPSRGELPPLPTRPRGNRARSLADFEQHVDAYTASRFPELEPIVARGLVTSALGWVKQPATEQAVDAWVRQHAADGIEDGEALSDEQRASIAAAGAQAVELNRSAAA